jgi:hypothetical protein
MSDSVFGPECYDRLGRDLATANRRIGVLISMGADTMSKLDELTTLAAQLQASIDATQAKVATAIQTLGDQIAALQATHDAALQPVIDSLTAAKADLESTPGIG